MNNSDSKINMSSFFDDLSAHYGRFEQNHDVLRSELMSEIKPYGLMADRSVSVINFEAKPGIGFAAYISRFAAIAAVLVLAFGLAMFNSGDQAGSSVVVAGNDILHKVTDFRNVHFKVTTFGSSMEMWWQRPNNYRMEFSDGKVIANNSQNYSCFDSKTGKLSLRPGQLVSGLEMFPLAELGEVFPFDKSPTQLLVKTSKVLSTTEVVFKGEDCYNVRTKNELSGDMLEYIVDKDQPMIYEIARIRDGRVISKVEVMEIDSVMPDSLFKLN